MALGDPAQIGYKAGAAGINSLGQGITQVAGLVGQKIQQKKQLQNTQNMLKQLGVLQEQPADVSDYENTLAQHAQQIGLNNLQVEGSADPEERKNQIAKILKASGLPLPQPKGYTFNADRAAKLGVAYDPQSGGLTVKPPASIASGMTNIPTGFEVIGYDQKGQPMIRKIERNIPAEKLDIEKQDKEKQLQEKSDFIKSQAQDTLDTISEVKKGINNFGIIGNVPKIPGTPEYTWATNVDKLLSGKMIDLMKQMKEASKTGATGFGQLSEKEGQILMNASTALKRGTSPEEAKKLLDKMESTMQKVLQKNQQPQSQGQVGKYKLVQ